MAENLTILRVQLDECKTEEQPRKLVLGIEATTKAQAALKAEHKAGLITNEQYAQQSVTLTNQLKAQRGEFAAN